MCPNDMFPTVLFINTSCKKKKKRKKEIVHKYSILQFAFGYNAKVQQK